MHTSLIPLPGYIPDFVLHSLRTSLGTFPEHDTTFQSKIEQHLRGKCIPVVAIEYPPGPGRVFIRLHAAIGFQHISEMTPELPDVVMQSPDTKLALFCSAILSKTLRGNANLSSRSRHPGTTPRNITRAQVVRKIPGQGHGTRPAIKIRLPSGLPQDLLANQAKDNQAALKRFEKERPAPRLERT